MVCSTGSCAAEISELLNERDGGGCSLLLGVARWGQPKLITELLELGATLAPAPLPAAAAGSEAGAGAGAGAGVSDGAVAMHHAARLGCVELIRVLYEYGVSPDCLDQVCGCAVLCCAVPSSASDAL